MMKKKPMYRRIADDYRSRIMSGELPPNAPIPSQTELSATLNTSLVTIKKAMSVLVEDGLIQRIRKKGTFVTACPRRSQFHSQEQLKKVYLVFNTRAINTISHVINNDVIVGISEEAYRQGIQFHLINLRGNMSLPDEVDAGFIIWGFWEQESLDYMRAMESWKAEGRRLVTVHHYFPHLDIPYVNCDNMSGGYLATHHLLSLGHERIGIILSGKSQIDILAEWSLRLQGYRMALAAYGIRFDPHLIYVYDAEQETEESGYEGFRSLMNVSEPPTAIFAASDFKALGAMYAAEDMGLSVPHDISIIGYDGYDFGKYSVPSLTTVDQNFHELGIRAMDLLSNQSTSGEALIAPKLIIRNSTGRLK